MCIEQRARYEYILSCAWCIIPHIRYAEISSGVRQVHVRWVVLTGVQTIDII